MCCNATNDNIQNLTFSSDEAQTAAEWPGGQPVGAGESTGSRRATRVGSASLRSTGTKTDGRGQTPDSDNQWDFPAGKASPATAVVKKKHRWMINNTNEQHLYILVKQWAKFTWMPAHKESFGIVLIKPNSDRSRKSNPGAKSSTFIFTDTAKLSEQRKEFVTCDKKQNNLCLGQHRSHTCL